MPDLVRFPYHYSFGYSCPLCQYPDSGGYVFFDFRVQYRQVAPPSCRKHEAPPPDTTTGVQLADASDLKGVCATAVEDKSSDTSKRKAPPPDITTGVQLADASDLKGVCAEAVEEESAGNRKRKAPPPDTTTGVQLELASPVKHKSAGTSKRKAPPPGTTGVQLADASVPKGVYVREVKDKSSGRVLAYKYEPRFTPPREKVDGGTTRRFNRLSLGEYRTPGEAKIMLQLAQDYYDKDQGCVELDDGGFKFSIPPMNEQERRLAGEEKRKWVTKKAKQVYADLRIQKRNFEQLSVGKRTGARSSLDSDITVSEIPSLFSANALEVPSCPAPLPLCDVVDALEVPSYPGPLPPCDVVDVLEVPSYSAPLPPCDVVDDCCETFSGLSDMLVDLPYPDSANFLPQQSSLNYEMHFSGFGQILGGPSSPQSDGVTQFFQGSIDAHLNPRVDFQQGWDPVGASGSNFFAESRDPVLQQLVHRQKQQLEVYALRIVGLEHHLCESQIRNSELQQKIERLTN